MATETATALAFHLAHETILVTILVEIAMRTKSLARVVDKQADWRSRNIVALFFGGFSMMGAYLEVELPSGAIANVGNLGPMVAGLVGGVVSKLNGDTLIGLWPAVALAAVV